jgi:hypothetical protein
MIPPTLAMLATTQKVRGIGSVPVPAFTQSRVIPGLQSRVRELAIAVGHKRTLAEQCSVMLAGSWSDGGLMPLRSTPRTESARGPHGSRIAACASAGLHSACGLRPGFHRARTPLNVLRSAQGAIKHDGANFP